MTYRMGELFAGYGGLGMAVEAALPGVERAWVSEFDPAPSRILARQWPEVPNLGDITAIDWAGVPPVDILTGGFPCQDVSLAGRRAGMKDGTRSALWSHMRAAIEQLRPGLVVIENVRGLLSAAAKEAPDDLGQCEWCLASGGGSCSAGTRSRSRRPGRHRVRCGVGSARRIPSWGAAPPGAGLHPRLACRRRPPSTRGTRRRSICGRSRAGRA